MMMYGLLIGSMECEEKGFGYNEKQWTAPADIAGGIYLYKITASRVPESKEDIGKLVIKK